MYSKRMKTFGIIALMIILTLTLAACENQNLSSLKDKNSNIDGLKVTVNPTAKLVEQNNDFSLMSIEDRLKDKIKSVTVEVYNKDGNEILVQKSVPFEDFSSSYTVVFASLHSGNQYDVKAKLVGGLENKNEGITLYASDKKTTEQLESNATGLIDLTVYPLDANSLTLDLVPLNGVDLSTIIERIKLECPTDSKEITFNGQDTISFNDGDGFDLIPTNWHISIIYKEDINNENLIGEIELLPTQELSLTLEISESGVDIKRVPYAPTNLSINTNGNLEWSGNNDDTNYTVLRGETKDQRPLEPVATLSNTIYEDFTLTSGYYYWVRAYNSEGLSGDLSDPIYIEDNIYNCDTKDYFSTIQSAIDSDNTSNENTILVGPGYYPEVVNIIKDLKLIGPNEGIEGYHERKEEAVINGSVNFASDTSNIVFDGFKVNYSEGASPIDIGQTNSPTIINNRVLGGENTYGIQSCDGSTSGTVKISYNEVSNGPIGVYSGNNSSSVIIENNYVGGAGDEAIWIYGGNEDITLTNNDIDNANSNESNSCAEIKIMDKPSTINTTSDLDNTSNSNIAQDVLKSQLKWDEKNYTIELWDGYIYKTDGSRQILVEEGQSIQSTIDSADAKDTVLIAPGTFTEDILLQKDISLKGFGRSKTFLNGTLSLGGHLQDVCIQDFTVENTEEPLMDADYYKPEFDNVQFVNMNFVYNGDSTSTNLGGKRPLNFGMGYETQVIGEGLTFQNILMKAENPTQDAQFMILQSSGGGATTFDNVTIDGGGYYHSINTYGGTDITVKNCQTKNGGNFYLSGLTNLDVTENSFQDFGICINGVDGADITNNIFENIENYSGLAITAAWGPTQNNNILIENNEFNNIVNDAIKIYNYTDSTPDNDFLDIHRNNFSNITSLAVNNTFTSFTANATNNWWGDASGPYHADKNSAGTGNSISDNVTFDPWAEYSF